MIMVLNCNPINGNVITDKTARITFYGVLDSIDSIYTNGRKTVNGETAGNDNFDHLEINGFIFDKSYCSKFYEALWWSFFKENQDMIDEIRKYDDYEDGLDDGVINSSARVFKIIKKYGMNGLSSNCKPFLIELRNREVNKTKCSDMQRQSFEELDLYIKELIRKNNDMSKRELLDIIKGMAHPETATLEKLLDIRLDEKNGDCSLEYLHSGIKRMKREYEKIDDEE